MSSVPTIACVLKSGGDYTGLYVDRLLASLRNHITEPYSSICFSDVGGMDETHLYLEHDLPAWWSKLEMFKIVGTVITMDLDIVPVGDCTALVKMARELLPNQFMTLKGLRQEPWCSSVMMWNGDLRWIEKDFLRYYENATHVTDKRGHHLIIEGEHYHGDQEWIMPQLAKFSMDIIPIQEHFNGIYSYKDNIRNKEFPDDGKIVCFHGPPRPHQIQPKPEWMQREGWTD